MSKQCFKCLAVKPLSEYYKHKKMKDGHLNKCMECTKDDVRTNYRENSGVKRERDRHRNRHNRSRIFRNRYRLLKARVLGTAAHPHSAFGKELLTYEEFCVWVTSNMDSFDAIYSSWEKSGFKRSHSPSIDRIDNSKGYIPSNMQWLSVSDNSKKYDKEEF